MHGSCVLTQEGNVFVGEMTRNFYTMAYIAIFHHLDTQLTAHHYTHLQTKGLFCGTKGI